MHYIMTFQSTLGCVCQDGPIRLYWSWKIPITKLHQRCLNVTAQGICSDAGINKQLCCQLYKNMTHKITYSSGWCGSVD